LSDIGFHGVSEPELDLTNCTGCGLCVTVCKRKAIEIKDKKAVIEMENCGHCGQCFAICPLNAIQEKRKGFAVLIGGKDGKETRLGTKIAEFVSEEKALEITENLLRLVKDKGGDASQVIDELGIDKVQELVVPKE
jgi:dissimilatory sulfite reductase (desulfoviridin) alpha/beta subunit